MAVAPDASEPDFLVVGHLNRVHGIKGEIYVWPLTDHPSTTYREGVVLRVSDPEGERPSDRFPSLEVEKVRPYKQGFLVKFRGLDDRTEAERFRGRYLMRSMEDVEDLGEGEIFYHQLLQMRVEGPDGRKLGVVREVYEDIGAADLLEIQGPRGRFHVPLVSSMIREVDVEERRLVLDPPEGLLDEPS